jgi:hypothetical protein
VAVRPSQPTKAREVVVVLDWLKDARRLEP